MFNTTSKVYSAEPARCFDKAEFPKHPARYLRDNSNNMFKSDREARDLEQRRAAKRKETASRKNIPKDVRAKSIKEKRRSENISRFGDFEEQGMGFIPKVCLGVGAAVACKTFSGVSGALCNISGRIVNLLDVANGVGGNMQMLINECLKLVKSLRDTALRIVGGLWVVPVSVLAYWLINKFVGNTSANLVLCAVFAGVFGKSIWSNVAEFFQPKTEEVHEQSGFPGSSFKNLLIVILCTSFLPSNARGLASALSYRLGSVPRMGDGIEGLFKAALDMTEKIVNFVFAAAGIKDADGKTRSIFFGDETTKAVKQWLNESYSQMDKLVGTPNPTLVREVYNHVRTGYAILQTIKDIPLSNLLKRGIDNLETKLAPFMGVITAGKNFRVEPHFVLFTGQSGVGKSSILVKFAVSILLLSGLCSPEEVLANLWQKGASEYWNGYVNQKCVVMDDVFQKIASKGDTESEYMDIIRVISNWSCPLNMADLNSKGKFYFDSPLVLGTTNCSNIHETTYKEVVKSSEAVVRRIHDVIYIEAAPEYAREDGTMDYAKLESTFKARLDALREHGSMSSAEIVDCIPWEAWRADKTDFNKHTFPTRGQPYQKPVDLRELVFSIAQSVKRKQEYHQASLDSLETFASLLGKAGDNPEITPQSGLGLECGYMAQAEVTFAANRLFESISDMYTPEIESAKLQNLCRAFSNKGSAQVNFALASEADANYSGALNSVYRRSMLSLVGVFDPEVFDDTKKVVCEALEKIAVAFQSNGFDRFFRKGALTMKEVEARMSHIVGILSNYKMCAAMGITCARHVALYSWLKSARASLDELYATIIESGRVLKHQTSLVEMCKAMVSGIFKSIKKLDFLGSWDKIATVGVIVGLLTTMGRLLFNVLKTVFVSICALLGFRHDDGDKGKVVFEEPTVSEQGNYTSVLQDDSVYSKVYGNLFSLYLPTSDILIGHILFVNGSVGVMPAHFDRQIREKIASGLISQDDPVAIYNGAQKYSRMEMSLRQFLAVPRYLDTAQITDTVFLNFPLRSNLMGKAKISNHFVSEADYPSVFKAVLPVRLDLTRIAKADSDVKVHRHTMFAPVVQKTNNLPIGKVTPPFVWSTSMTTRLGDCGAPLMVSRLSLCPKSRSILGIHVAGNTCPHEPKACAIPVSLEMVRRAMDFFKVIEDDFEDDMASKGINLSEVPIEEQAGLYSSGLVGGSFELIGKVDKPVNIAPRSQFTKTPLHSEQPFGPSGLKVAHLRPVEIDGEIKYPMVEGLKNYQTPVIWRDIPDLDLAVSVATQRFCESSVFDTRDIFTFEEAVMSPALLKLKAINRATSPGYPFVLDGMPGKTGFFGNLEDYVLTGDKCNELRFRCENIVDSARKGVRLSHLYIDFLKDETRPEAKVDACATRVISGAPVDYVIVFRQYFGAIMAAMFRNHTVSGFTPGINPYQEWWVLASKLTDVGTNYFDGDFSRFDASEQPYILWAVLDFINNWYNDGEENARIRRVLFMDLAHSRHITSQQGSLRYVVQWNKSLPSGHPMTTFVNSLYAMISLVICYGRLTGNFTDFWDECYAATNGDDNIVSVSDKKAPFFNQVTVAGAMGELLDLKYTSGSKDGRLREFCSIEDLTFLKRRFLRDEGNQLARGGWIAPLDYQSFLFSAYFTRAKRDVPQDIAKNLEFALGELSLHPESSWDDISPKIFTALTRFGFAPKLGYSRDSYRQFMSSKTDFWY
jgi:hypothetical protein